MKRLLKDKRGEGFVDVCVLVLAIAMVLALVVRIAPVFVAKQNLDVFADELVRTAEINGQVGSATNAKAADLREQTGLDPNISWSDTGKIQPNIDGGCEGHFHLVAELDLVVRIAPVFVESRTLMSLQTN